MLISTKKTTFSWCITYVSQQNFHSVRIEQNVKIFPPQSRLEKGFSGAEPSPIFCRRLRLHESDVGESVDIRGSGLNPIK
jgi:hypothetical protein